MADTESMGKLEQVARAICFSDASKMTGPGTCKAQREFSWEPDGAHIDKFVDRHWKEHTHAAHFAMLAMAVPTNAMLDAGGAAMTKPGGLRGQWDVYAAMIDAALNEQSEKAGG